MHCTQAQTHVLLLLLFFVVVEEVMSVFDLICSFFSSFIICVFISFVR